MKRSTAPLVVALYLLVLVPTRSANAQTPVATALEAKIRQAWKDWQNKKESAFASVLADDAVEVEGDGRGPRDKKATLADMRAMNMNNFVLSDFKFTRLGSSAELATYNAKVDLTVDGQNIKAGVAVSEVWVKRNGSWKLLHYQETEVK